MCKGKIIIVYKQNYITYTDKCSYYLSDLTYELSLWYKVEVLKVELEMEAYLSRNYVAKLQYLCFTSIFYACNLNMLSLSQIVWKLMVG